MLRKIKLILIIIGFCFITNNAQTKQINYSPLTQLTWKVSSTGNNYYLGIPIRFNFQITNNTTFPTKKYGDGFGLYLDMTYVDKKNNIKKTKRFTRLTHYTNDFILVNQIIAPNGHSITLKRTQEFDFDGMFEESGEYHLTFIVPYDGIDGEVRELKLNPVIINFEKPQGVDKEAYNYLNQDKKDTLYGRFIRNINGGNQLEAIFNKFEKSIYGQYALCLALQWYKSKNQTEKVEQITAKLKQISNPTIAAEIGQNKKP